jgi:peptidyl-prolyl cis-trans isomerase SurA
MAGGLIIIHICKLSNVFTVNHSRRTRVHLSHHIRTISFNLTGMLVAGMLVIAGCSPKEHDAVVATIGNHVITLPEYEQHYLKTLGTREAGVATTMEERQKFLDLLVKYRLKLAGAYRDGLDKKPEILGEIGAYKGSLAASFLTEREVVLPGIRQLYARRNEEIRASHILLPLNPDASPTDSALAYNKAFGLIRELKEGKDFGALAAEHSQDQSAKQNLGDLYYFTAGQMVAPFEDAVFAMKAGDISSVPVRTQFGLHIIKIVDRKLSQGEVHASHIMIRFPSQDPTPDDTASTFRRMVAVRDSVLAGVDFAELARRNSEDPGSSSRGGDLGYFGRRRWVQPFDEVAMMLRPGQVSGIIRTVYGYHIIKCHDIRPRKSFEEAKPELQPIYQQLRFQDDYAKYLDRIKNQVRYQRNERAFMRLTAAVDTTKATHDSAWWAGITPAVGQLPLFSVQGQDIAIDSAIAVIKTRPDFTNVSLRPQSLSAAMDKIGEHFVFTAKADLLQKDIPEFASLLKEYREGILLYQVEQDNVWNKIAVGDSALKIYFSANRDRFTWPDRINFTEVKSSRDSLVGVIRQLLSSGKSLDRIATEDSVRMALPSSYRVVFGKRSTTLDTPSRAAMAAMADEMKRDRNLRLSITARPDTTTGKAQQLKLAAARLGTVTAYLTKSLKLSPPLISVFTVPLPSGPSSDSAVTATYRDALDITLSGREPLLLGPPQTAVLPAATDDRTKRADSLSVGGTSPPFLFGGYYCLVRLNGRENARRKTFEEAGADLSSAYQDHESKRLETEWLGRLRKDFPVVTNAPVLKNAFVPPQR